MHMTALPTNSLLATAFMASSVGLKGVDPANQDKVPALVLDKLEQLAKEGFTPTAIEAAINTIEFSLRENNTGSFPRGLSLMLRAVGAWIYDRWVGMGVGWGAFPEGLL
jgi:Zn-dependent M16 (insulinase) family peptidase